MSSHHQDSTITNMILLVPVLFSFLHFFSALKKSSIPFHSSSIKRTHLQTRTSNRKQIRSNESAAIITCRQLGNVLFNSRMYNDMYHTLQWNGMKQDRGCCDLKSQCKRSRCLYCHSSSIDRSKLETVNLDIDSSYDKFCNHDNLHLSYSVVPWKGNSAKDVCIIIDKRPSRHGNFVIRKLQGENRRPSAAIINFDGDSPQSKKYAKNALKTLRDMQETGGSSVLLDTVEHVSTKNPKLSSSRVFSTIVRFNSTFLEET